MNVDDWLEKYGIGLHDAEVHQLTIDYTRKTAAFDLEVWIQDDEIHGTGKDMYRRAMLTFVGMEYCTIEPPDARYPYDKAEPLCIDLVEVQPGDARYLATRADDAFRCRIFVNSWNAFLSICACSVVVEWLGEAHDGPERLA